MYNIKRHAGGKFVFNPFIIMIVATRLWCTPYTSSLPGMPFSCFAPGSAGIQLAR
jgi:hypothetical protein